MVLNALDTLKFSQTLQAAGVPKEQAEAHAIAFAEVVKVNFQELVTLDAFQNGNALMRGEQREGIAQLRTELHETTSQLRAELQATRQQLEAKIDVSAAKLNGEMMLLKWMMGVNLTLMVAILVLLFFFRTF